LQVAHGVVIMHSNRRNIDSLGKRLLIGLCGSVVVSGILTMLIAVPFVCVIPCLLTFPLSYIWPELSSTGDLIEVGFLWVTIRQAWLWPVFFAYFLLVTSLPLCVLLFCVDRLRR